MLGREVLSFIIYGEKLILNCRQVYVPIRVHFGLYVDYQSPNTVQTTDTLLFSGGGLIQNTKYFYFLIFFYGNKDCEYNLTKLKILNLIIKIKIINEPQTKSFP